MRAALALPILTPSALYQDTWYSASWLQRLPIIIPGSLLNGSLTSMAVPVALTNTAFANALASGYDFTFTDSAGNVLPYERESFASNTLYAWVNVPVLSAGQNTLIYLYWQNSGASDQQNVSGTWDANFLDVWHFKDGSGATVTNSVSGDAGNQAATPGLGTITWGAGAFDEAMNLPGSTDYLASAANATDPFTLAFTMEAWVNFASIPAATGAIVSSAGATNGSNILGLLNTGKPQFNSPGGGNPGGSTALNTGAWAYIICTKSTANSASGNLNGYSYQSGVAVHQVSNNAQTTFVANASQKLNVGGAKTGLSLWAVALDEVRYSNVVRSTSYMQTLYNLMTGSLTTGAVQTL